MAIDNERALQFGHFFLPTYLPELDGDMGSYLRFLVDFAASSEDLGFDSIWANEHHFSPYGGLLPSLPVFLAAVAQRTSGARLGTSITVLSLHNPIEIAEQLAMLDLMSGGRLELGVGRGYATQDYEAMGVPVEQGQERTLEGLEVLLKAWQGGPLTHHGQHYHYENLEVWPKPEQSPWPHVWMACSRTPASFEAAARRGCKLLTIAHVNPLERLAELTGVYRDAWITSGRDPADCDIATHFNVYVDEDPRRAWEIGTACVARSNRQSEPTFPEAIAGFHKTPVDELIGDGRVIAGDPEQCVAMLARLQDRIGFTSMRGKFAFGGMARSDAERSLRLFGTQVIPALRERRPAEPG